MKRGGPLQRRTPLPAGRDPSRGAPVRGGSVRARREAPRARTAPRWTAQEWEEASIALWKRSGGRCECCLTPLDGRAERAHRIRRRDGGDRLSNLLLLLPEHHARSHSEPDAARRAGIIVSSYAADPERVPVLWHGKRWVFLLDDGSVRPAPTGGDYT